MAEDLERVRARVIPPPEPDPDTVGGILRRYGPQWAAGRRFTYRQASALRSMAVCRTEACGTRRDVCGDCGTVRLTHLSCGDRHCPQCQYAVRQAWLEARCAELLRRRMCDLPARARGPRPVLRGGSFGGRRGARARGPRPVLGGIQTNCEGTALYEWVYE